MSEHPHPLSNLYSQVLWLRDKLAQSCEQSAELDYGTDTLQNAHMSESDFLHNARIRSLETPGAKRTCLP